MKIAILASGSGEKALHLHEFFKEGDRIDIHCLLTDNPESALAEALKADGIDVVPLEEDVDRRSLVSRLKDADVRLLVVDGYEDGIPEEFAEHFGENVVCPTRPETAPIEVINVIDRMNSVVNPDAGGASEARRETKSAGEKGVDTAEDEWARALEIDRAEIHQAPRQQGQPPVYPQQPPVYPQQPQYQQPGYQYQGGMPAQAQGQAPVQMQGEPMPDTYLVWAVIITILCSLIPGIIAIIFSTKVSSRYYAGDIDGAKRASRLAQIWCIVSIVLGVIWTTLYVPLSLLSV